MSHKHSSATPQAAVTKGSIKNVSPLRYPGGKTRGCAPLLEILKSHCTVDHYNAVVSPFFGGGSFEFKLQELFGWIIIANDGFAPLINFWQHAKSHNSELVQRVQSIHTGVTKEKLIGMRKELPTMAPLEQAACVFAINRSSFSGATLSGGFSEGAISGRFTPSSIQRLTNLDLSKTTFQNEDFTTFLDPLWSPNHLVFLDPPYYLESRSKLYGKAGDMHEAFPHEGLRDMLKGKNNWIMTYNDCEWVRKAYNEYLIIDASWAYGMNKSKESSEVVILPKPGV
jgi:DNA adenine methylase